MKKKVLKLLAKIGLIALGFIFAASFALCGILYAMEKDSYDTKRQTQREYWQSMKSAFLQLILTETQWWMMQGFAALLPGQICWSS